MRIGFLGKGGSGKTALSTLFSQYLASRGDVVWYFDCDVNQHGSERLGKGQALVPALAENFDEIKEYLSGENPRIESPKEMQKTTPPGRGSKLFRTLRSNVPILSTISCPVSPSLRIFRTGTVTSEQVGHKCHHYSVGAAELILTHTVEDPGEWIVCDLAAGTDVFASPLFSYLDVLLVICTPSIYSLDVLDTILERKPEFEYNIGLVLNRWSGDRYQSEYQKLLNSGSVYADVPYNDYFYAVEDWVVGKQKRSPNNVESPNYDRVPEMPPRVCSEMENLRCALLEVGHDRSKLLETIKKYHVLNCLSWINRQVGKDLTAQIDPEFFYP